MLELFSFFTCCVILRAEAWPVVALLLPTHASTTTLAQVTHNISFRLSMRCTNPSTCDYSKKCSIRICTIPGTWYVDIDYFALQILSLYCCNAATHPSTLVPTVYCTPLVCDISTSSYKVRTAVFRAVVDSRGYPEHPVARPTYITQLDRGYPLLQASRMS